MRSPLIDISSGTIIFNGDNGQSVAYPSSCSGTAGCGGGGSASFLTLLGNNLSTAGSSLQGYGGNGGSGCTGSSCGVHPTFNGGGGGAGGRIKLFYKSNLFGIPTYNVNGGSGGAAGSGGGFAGSNGGSGTYYTAQSSSFNLVPGVILSSPTSATNFFPQIGSTTKVPWNYVCNQYDTPVYLDGSDLLKNNTFYLWNSTGSLIYSHTTSITGSSNQTNDIYYLTSNNYGNYYWNCYVCDNQSECSWATQNNTFSVTQPFYAWLTTLTYDLLIAPASISQTLWAISTTGTGNVSIGSLIALANSTDIGFGSSISIAEANATNLPNSIYIDNITFPVQLICSNGDTGSVYSQVDAFGTTIKSATCNTPASSDSDNTIWFLQQNYTAGTNKFDVYNDGVWQQQITATNNIIRLYAYASGATAPFITKYSMATINNVTYSLNTNFMNITLGLPVNGSSITNPYFNFTATTNLSLNTLSNASIFIDNVNQMTLPLNGTNASLLFPIMSMGIGTHNWYVVVCDNANNCESSETRTFSK